MIVSSPAAESETSDLCLMVAQLKSKAEFDACVNGTDKWVLRAHPRTYITWRTPPLYTPALWRPELGGRLVFDLCAKWDPFFCLGGLWEECGLVRHGRNGCGARWHNSALHNSGREILCAKELCEILEKCAFVRKNLETVLNSPQAGRR